MRRENAQKLRCWPLTRWSTGSGPIDRFVEMSFLMPLPHLIFSPVSFSFPRVVSFQLLRSDFWRRCSILRGSDWFLEARALDLGLRASDLGWVLLCLRAIASFSSIFARLGLLIGFIFSWLCSFLSLLASSHFFSILLMDPKRRQQPPRLRVSALLSRLSLLRWRLTERWGMIWPSSVP